MLIENKKVNNKTGENGRKKESEEGEEAGARDADLPPPPPDGGWGWMVVFGSFLIHVIADGIAYSFGVYVEAFIEEFEASRSQVGFLGSLMLGVTWCSGPIASMMTNKFGCRLVSILGTIIAAFGFIISLFAPSIYFMFFSFGIVVGIGLGLLYLPAIVAVSFYFEKRRSLATGLAVCGAGFGTFIFAPLTQLLLHEYGWKGTVLIETGLLLNCIPCGAVFRPLPATHSNKSPSARLTDQPERERVDGIPEEKEKLSSGGSEGRVALNVATDDTHESSRQQPGTMAMTQEEILLTGSLQNIPMYRTDPATYHRRSSSIHPGLPLSSSSSSSSSNGIGDQGSSSSGKRPRLMDWRLMLDVCFLIFAVSNLLTNIGYCIVYVFLPDRATVAGLTQAQAAFLISIVGISNTVGRIVFGFIADYKWINRLMLYCTVLVLCGLASLISTFVQGYAWMAAYAACFGLFMGVYICLTPTVLVDLIGLDRLSNAFGIVLLFQGVGAVIGPPMAGAVYDATKDYNNSFYLMGVCIAVSGAMLYCIPCIQRCQATSSSSSSTQKREKDAALT